MKEGSARGNHGSRSAHVDLNSRQLELGSTLLLVASLKFFLKVQWPFVRSDKSAQSSFKGLGLRLWFLERCYKGVTSL